MKSRYLYQIFIISLLILIPHYTKAQSTNDSNITIKDHNGSTTPIVSCDYKFNNPDKSCITLTVDYPTIKDATVYSVKSINYSPFGNFTEGTEVPITKSDDYWSGLIELPFNFCLYGKSFSSLILSDNGAISFNIPEDANTKAPYNIPSADDGVSSVVSEGKLLPYTIYGVFHDLIMDPNSFECISSGGCGKITTYTEGKAPFRKFIINYNNMNQFNCNNIKSTFQIVLYETTNVIDIYIKQKPASCEDGKSEKYRDVALIGITNNEGIGLTAPGRDDITKWTTDATGTEAWKFEPQGDINPIVTWYNSDFKILASKVNSIEICPTSTTTYYAEVTYNSCGLSSLRDSISIVFDKVFPATQNVVENICVKSLPVGELDFMPLIKKAITGEINNFNYYLYLNQQDANDDKNRITGTKSDSETLYLRVEDKNNKSCFTIASLTIYKRTIPNYEGEQTYEFCSLENEEAVIKDIRKNGILDISGPYNEWIALYFYTQAEALNYTEGSNISSIDVLKLPAPPSTITIFAKIFNMYAPECFVVVPVKIQANPSKDLPPVGYYKCEPFSFDDDLTQRIKEMPDHENYTFKFYTSKSDALKDINSISENPNAYPRTTKYPVRNGKVIYVKAQGYENDNCPPITEIVYNIKLGSIQAYRMVTCDTYGSGTGIADIEYIFINFMKEGREATNVSYYDNNGKIPDNLINKYPYSNSSNIITIYYSQSGCVFETKLQIDFIKRVEKRKTFNVCDINNDGEEGFVLKNLTSMFSENYGNSLVTYYLSASDRDNDVNRQTSVLLKKGQKESQLIYVKVFFYGTSCSNYYEISLLLTGYAFENTYNYKAKVCDNNLDDQEIINLTNYESDFVKLNNPSDFNFKYYLTYNNAHDDISPIAKPEQYLVQNLSNAVIYVRISNNSDCFSIVELTFENINFIKADDAEEYFCDNDGNGYEGNINLPNLVKMKMNAPEDAKISYHEYEDKANENSVSTITKNPENYSITATTIVYVRFERDACYTVRKLKLHLESTPKNRPASLTICDDNFDGVYMLTHENLDDINSQIIREDIQDHLFYYYQDPEGKNSINPLTYPLNDLPYKNAVLYVKTSKNGCKSSISKITISTMNTVSLISPAKPAQQCDDNFDGYTAFNLGEYVKQLIDTTQALPLNPQFSIYNTYEEAQLQKNPKNINSYININAKNDVAYVRLNSTSYCPSIIKIDLEVLPLPISTLPKDYLICPNESLLLNADTGNPDDYYKWSTGEEGKNLNSITITSAGNYSVIITGSNGCSYTYFTKVVNYESIIINSVTVGDDYLRVNATGPEPLEYSLDNKNWQESNIFNNLEPAIYTVYVRSQSIPCKPVNIKAVIFKVPNTITPNNDGYNDAWNMCDLDLFNGEKSSIKIFDRYGKTLFEESSNTCFTWNGYYLGRPLPTNSYWYIINVPDGRKLTGWILLKNYNSTQMK